MGKDNCMWQCTRTEIIDQISNKFLIFHDNLCTFLDLTLVDSVLYIYIYSQYDNIKRDFGG